MKDNDKKDLALFHNYLVDFANNIRQYGNYSYSLYNLKYFVYDVPEKSLPYIEREIKVNEDKIKVQLIPQTIFNKKTIEAKYLGEREHMIFSYIMYSFCWNQQYIGNKPCVMITLKEINRIFKFSYKVIRESLDLLSKYKVYFETKSYQDGSHYSGVLPVQFINGFVYDSKTKKTLIYLTNEMREFILSNKSFIMNYKQLFSIKGRIARLLYQRINITNVMNFKNEEQYLELKETVCSFLQSYGITYKERYQKQRLFKEIKQSLEELKSQNIINSYKLTEIIGERQKIIDYKLSMKLNPTFCLQFSVSQKGKELIEKSKDVLSIQQH